MQLDFDPCFISPNLSCLLPFAEDPSMSQECTFQKHHKHYPCKNVWLFRDSSQAERYCFSSLFPNDVYELIVSKVDYEKIKILKRNLSRVFFF